MATEVASLFARVGADTTSFRSGMNAVNSSIHATAGAFRNFTTGIVQGIGQAFGQASLRVLREFGEALKGTISNAADLEQGIADIGAILNTTAEESASLQKLITDLGVDPKLKVTAAEAADAIEMLAKNGLDAKEILDGAARSTVLLANSTGADFPAAADIATSAMSAFKIEAGNMADAVNQIVGVVQNSKLDMNDYRLAISQAGGVAGAVGIEFEDFNAILTGTAHLFGSGSDQGTAFKTFVQRLVPQSAEAADAMRKLGLYTGLTGQEFEDVQAKIEKTQAKIDDLDPTSKNYQKRFRELKEEMATLQGQLTKGSNAFFDANGQIKSVSAVSQTLKNAFSGLSEEQRISAATTIFGTDAMRMAFGMMDLGTDAVNEYKAAIGATDAEASAARRMDTLRGDYEIFQGILETLSTQIGQKFLPHLRSLVQWSTAMATQHGPAVIEWFGQLAEKLPNLGQRALAFWDMISGPGVVGTIKLLWEAFGQLGRVLSVLVRPFREAFSGLFQELQAMRSTGFTDIFQVVMRRLAQAIRGFADAIRTQIAPSVWAGLKEIWKGVVAWIGSISWEDIVGWAKAIWGWAVELWATIYPYLQAFWAELSSWVTDPTKRQILWDAVVTGWNVFAEYATAIWDWMSPGLTAAWNYLSSWVTDPTKRQILWEAVVTGWNVFTEWATALWDWMSPGLTAAWEAIRYWVADPSKRLQLYSNASEWGKALIEWSFDVWKMISPYLASFWENISSWVTDPTKRQQIIDVVLGWGRAITDWANYLWNGGEGFEGMQPKLARWWAAFDEWMRTNFPQTRTQLGEISDAFHDFFTELDTLLRTDTDGIKRTWDDIWQTLFGDAKRNWDAGIAEILKNSREFVDILRGVGLILEGFKTNTWGPIWAGVKEIATSAWAIIKSNLDVNPFFQGLVSMIRGWGNNLRDAWRAALDMAADAVRTGMIALAGAFTGIGRQIFDALAGGLNSIGQLATDVADKLMLGLVYGIRDRMKWVTDIGGDLARAVLDPIKHALGIASPSRVFRELGANVAEGFALGIGDSLDVPAISVNKLVRTTVQAVPAGGVALGSDRPRLDVYLHAGEGTLPTNRQQLQELMRMLQRELVLAGARASY